MTLFPYQIIFLSTGGGAVKYFNLSFLGNTFQLITSYTPMISLLGIYPGEMKTYLYKDLREMFIAALFTVTQNWKQSKHLATVNG